MVEGWSVLLDEKTESLLVAALSIGARTGIDKFAALLGVDVDAAARAAIVQWVAEHALDLVPDRVISVGVVAGGKATGVATFGDD